MNNSEIVSSGLRSSDNSASLSASLRIGDWQVDVVAGRISRNGETVRLDARTLQLLLVLAERPGETVSIEELLDRVWVGVVVTSDSVYQGVATLRRLLGDNPKEPRYIATVPRLGYRMVAAVVETPKAAIKTSEAVASLQPAKPPSFRRIPATVAVVLAVAGLIVGLIFLWPSDIFTDSKHISQPRVGVAPFVDLTPSMDQAELADEMTEGVADRLSRDPTLYTPGFRSSYYLIGTQTSIAQAGRTLDVAYVVDGSVRKSEDTVRIAARLVRADSGVVLWSQVFEQPVRKLDIAQDDIARAVTTALAKIGAATG